VPCGKEARVKLEVVSGVLVTEGEVVPFADVKVSTGCMENMSRMGNSKSKIAGGAEAISLMVAGSQLSPRLSKFGEESEKLGSHQSVGCDIHCWSLGPRSGL